MSREGRENLLDALKSRDAKELPHAWRMSLLATYVQDLLATDFTTEQCSDLAKLCVPRSKDEESLAFSLHKPALKAMQATGAELGASWTKLVMESLLPIVALGKVARTKLARWSAALAVEVASVQVSCVIVSAAKEEIAQMLQATQMLAADEENMPKDLSSLKAIFEAKAGSRFTLKLALQQSPFYKEQERSLTCSWSATLSFKPEMEKLQSRIGEGEVEAGMSGEKAH